MTRGGNRVQRHRGQSQEGQTRNNIRAELRHGQRQRHHGHPRHHYEDHLHRHHQHHYHHHPLSMAFTTIIISTTSPITITITLISLIITIIFIFVIIITTNIIMTNDINIADSSSSPSSSYSSPSSSSSSSSSSSPPPRPQEPHDHQQIDCAAGARTRPCSPAICHFLPRNSKLREHLQRRQKLKVRLAGDQEIYLFILHMQSLVIRGRTFIRDANSHRCCVLRRTSNCPDSCLNPVP